jgi:pimeloyl-ACP methyl ester carboxylesterase
MFDFDSRQVLSAICSSKSFAMAARFWTGKVLFKLGSEAYLLEVNDGKAASFRRDDALLATGIPMSAADMVVSGPADSWDKLLSEVPPPGFHDPLFIAGGAGFQVEGDGITAIGPFFRPVQEVIDVLRQVRNGSPPPDVLPEVDRDFDAAVGRYMYVSIQGVQYRIYYEEAGDGAIPLLLQHTAGADSRQWRHVLEDPDYQKMYRMICYDLPFHGRSLPPTTQIWWENPYKLTRSFLMDAVIAISRKLGLDRPVYMGCSVGGMLAPDLAFYHPEEFRAVIGLNGALGFDPSQRVEAAWELWSNPRIGPQWTMALIRSNIAPTSDEVYRRETMWVYSQGGPGVNEGDIHYYAYDHDLTEEQASQIDTSVVAVYLITGAYDGLALDRGSERLAKAVKGSHFMVVPGLGHFGPAENPAGIKTALLPVLQEIAANSRDSVLGKERLPA